MPLTTETGGLQVSVSLGAAWSEIAPMLGMRPAPVARREVTAYREQASRVQAALAGGIASRPARPAEIVWMIQHALHRRDANARHPAVLAAKRKERARIRSEKGIQVRVRRCAPHPPQRRCI